MCCLADFYFPSRYILYYYLTLTTSWASLASVGHLWSLYVFSQTHLMPLYAKIRRLILFTCFIWIKRYLSNRHRVLWNMLYSNNNGLLNKSRHTHNTACLFVHWNVLSGRTSHLQADNRSLHRLGYCVEIPYSPRSGFQYIFVPQGVMEYKVLQQIILAPSIRVFGLLLIDQKLVWLLCLIYLTIRYSRPDVI